MTFSTGLGRCSTFACGLDHPEGVAWDPGTQTVYAGGRGGQLYAVTLGGSSSPRIVARTGGALLGLAIDGAGAVYVCDAGRSEVRRIDVATGVLEPYSTGTPARPMRTPNWPAFGPDGTLYVTDSGTWEGGDGVVYRIIPGGATEVWAATVPAFPNGCCVAPDGDALFVVQSNNSTVSRLVIESDGSAGEPVVVCELPDTVVLDGIALDEQGGLYISCYQPNRLYRVPPHGEPAILLDDTDAKMLNSPTNLAFFGAPLERVVLAALGGTCLVEARLGVRGSPLHRPLPVATGPAASLSAAGSDR